MKLSVQNIKNKLLIVVRHGERSDKIGLIPVLGYCDPELTKRGEEQAYNIGKIIKNKLIQNQIQNRILLISSPFARTLQTSKNLLRALKENKNSDYKINNEILVHNLFCEYINQDLIKENHMPKDYLTIFRENKFLEESLKDVEFSHLLEKDVLPTCVENDEMCSIRMKKAIDHTIENYLKTEEVEVVILVSHASPINYMNKWLGYGGPFGWLHIEYCDAFVYSFDMNKEDENKTEFVEKLRLDEFNI